MIGKQTLIEEYPIEVDSARWRGTRETHSIGR